MTAADIIDPVNDNHNASWTYDAVGNRLSDTTNGVTTSYSYDANDRLLTRGSQSFTYDDRGSTLSESDGITTDTFVYGSRNKLVEAMVEGSLLTMSYDMDGNRVGKTVNNVPVNYVVDNNHAYAQVVVEEQAADTLDYEFGTDLLSLDSVSGEFTYHTDALGSNRLLTDSAGSSADELGYDAWGEVLAGGDLTENQYRYTGEQFDSDLGQVYLRARYLDTARGAFTQMDTFPGFMSRPLSTHKYLYANASPINVIDPSGKFGIASFGTAKITPH